jgi:hypothetical protein
LLSFFDIIFYFFDFQLQTSGFREKYKEVEELKKTVASLSDSLPRIPADPFGVFKESLDTLNPTLKDIKSDLKLISEHEQKVSLLLPLTSKKI